MQNKPQSLSFFKKFIIFTLILAFIALYCQYTFPSNLKAYSPQKFQSHPVKDLTPHILSLASTPYTFYNDKIIGLCQDVQVGSNDIAYCVNERSEVITIDSKTKKVQKIGKAQRGISYGARLSKNEKLLYFINSQLGLCQFNIQTKQVKSLVSQFQGKFLNALNSIQIHPNNQDLIYITQTNPQISMDLHTVDILLNNPFGRLYQFNKKTGRLSFLTGGLYFANGVVFQKYKNYQTLLVAQTNRFRMIRVYLNGQKRGEKQVAVDKLDFYLDNVKINQKGDIWVAGPSQRDALSYFADYNPVLRLIISRLPSFLFPYLVNAKRFGGVKITFSQNNQQHQLDYYLWNSLPNFTFATTALQKNNKLYLSSLIFQGVIVIQNLDQLKKIALQNNTQNDENL